MSTETTTPNIEEIEQLVGFLPKLDSPGFKPIKKWRRGTKDSSGVYSMPWPEYGPIVDYFFEAAGKDCWCDYEYDPVATAPLVEDPAFIANATLQQLKTMITFCVRGERFSDGFRARMIENGHIRNILERLQELLTKWGAISVLSILSECKNRLTTDAFDALVRGIERERKRLSGFPFITMRRRDELDYDGLLEYLELLEGFDDAQSAIDYIERLKEKDLADCLAEPSDYYPWQKDTRYEDLQIDDNHESAAARCIKSRCITSMMFGVKTGSGFDSKYFWFDVLEVHDSVLFGPDLIVDVDAEDQWVHYFISKGRE